MSARFAALIATCAVVALGGCASVSPAGSAVEPEVAQRFPRDASRFELRVQTDSTVSFTPAEAEWIASGLLGIAVDPALGDALVARVRIVAVEGDTAVALVTGQTTRLTEGQVLLLVPPAVRWWRQRLFWLGVASGGGAMLLASVLLLL